MTFEWGRRTYVMGILNATPDSFSGDGLLTHEDWIVRAVAHARRFVDEGVDIIDIGGESTRPEAHPLLLRRNWKGLSLSLLLSAIKWMYHSLLTLTGRQ